MVAVLITNGGPHSAGDWAVFTTEQIVQIADTASGTSASAGRKLENNIITVLEDAFTALQTAERGHLAAGSDHLMVADDIAEMTSGWVTAIVGASVGTEFEGHFAKEDVVAHITDLVGHMAISAIDVERSWYCDAHADDPNAIQYRSSRPF